MYGIFGYKGPVPTPCGCSAHLLPHQCCPHQALLSQTCRLDPVLGTQHAALPAPPQQTSERLKLEPPSPPSPPVQVTAASAARQQGCLPSSTTFPSRRLGLPGTSPTSAAQIRERKTARPATIPQRHCLAVKQRDSTEAGPPGAPPPSSPHRLSMGAL